MEVEFVSSGLEPDDCCDTIVIHPDDLISSEDECEVKIEILTEEDVDLMSADVDSTRISINEDINSSSCDSDLLGVLTDENSIKGRKKKTKDDLLPPVCHICKKTFSCTFTKNIHLRTVHTDERPFLCDFCCSGFKRKDHLQKHIKIIHNDGPTNLAATQSKKYVPVKFLCAQCGKIFCNKTTHQQHVDSVHSGVKKYHCEPCNKSFSRYSKLYRHKVVLNHGKNQFLKSCSYCGLEFESEIYYVRHMTKHEEVKTCEKCDQQFNSNQDFKNHVAQVHCEKKNLACDVCGKTYGNKTSLILHKRSHEINDKPFQCDHCGWKFKNRGHLVVHMYRHTGERPYKCSICNRGFKQKGDMRKHKAGHLINQKRNTVIIKTENDVNHAE